MRLIFSFAFIITIATNSFANYVDTIDYWTVRLNGKPIINSNETAIMYDQPMTINLSSFTDTDKIEICYWTDHGSERKKWYYILKDFHHIIIDTFTNQIDSSLDSKNLYWRKNYISFTVAYLRRLLKEKNTKQIFVQFEFADNIEQNPYRDKSICLIADST